nr:VapB-type antitoxin [Candidatus Njordarchaeota archaeon]
MTTISVTDDVKQKLLQIASELQIKFRRRVDLDEAIRYLINEKEKKPQLLEEACKPAPEADKALEELYAERKVDEERLGRKASTGCKRAD